MAPDESPYVGPTPFLTGDRKRFFGRDREIGELTSLVLAHPITLLVSGSGAGKTSLVNAGLIPTLTGADSGIARCEVLPGIRFNAMPAHAGDTAAQSNPFIAYTVDTLAGDSPQPPDGAPGSLAEHLQRRKPLLDRMKQPLPRLLIFDQFEEMFSLYPQYWEHRLPFVKELVVLVEADPMARVLLVMRSEYLARLELLTAPTFTSDLRIRLHLERLDAKQALLAVTCPLPDEVSFAPGVAEALVDELRQETFSADSTGEPVHFEGKYIEPVQLQAVCQALWQNLPAGATVVTEELRQQYGSVDRALEDFYANALTAAVQNVPPGTEAAVRHWIEDALISPRRSRNTVQREDAEARGIPAPVLDALVTQHILRPEDRSNVLWLELTHDRLVSPIKANNESWFKDNPDPLYSIQQLTSQWLREGKPPGYLLTADALAGAASFAQELPDLLSRDELEFVRASEELQRNLDENDRRRKRFRNLAAGFLVFAIAMVALAAFAFYQMREADQKKEEADQARQVSLSRAVASQSILADARSQDDLAALLARQAYLFDSGGDVLGDTGTALQATAGAPNLSTLLPTPHLWISSLAFSPDDGTIMASAGGDSGDSAVILWDFDGETYRLRRRLIDPRNQTRSHSSGVTGIAFDQSGRQLASGGGDGYVKLWDLGSGGLTARLQGPGGPVRAVAFGVDPSGRQMLAATGCGSAAPSTDEYDGGSARSCGERTATVRIWTFVDGEAELAEDLETLDIQRFDTVMISDDGRWLVAGGCVTLTESPRRCSNGVVLIWDRTDPDADPIRFDGYQGTIYAVDLLSLPEQPTLLAAAGEDRTIRLWNLEALAEASTEGPVLLGHRQVIQSLAFSPDGSLLAAGDHDAIIGSWDLSQPDPVISILGSSTEWIRSLAFKPDGSLLASASGGGRIRLWQLGQSGIPPAVLSGHQDYVRSFDFAPVDDRTLLASAAEDGTARLWTLGSTEPTQEIIQIAEDDTELKLSSVAFDYDGNSLLIAGQDGVIRLATRDDSEAGWSIATVNPTELPGNTLLAIFSPEDDLVFAADSSGDVWVWDLTQPGTEGMLVSGGEGDSASLAIALSRDGTLLAVGDASGRIRLWALSDGGRTAEPLPSLDQRGAVRALDFGPDGLLAAGGSADGSGATVKVWDIAASAIVATLPVKQDEVRSVSFSPDGAQLATGSKDQSVMLWDTSSWESQPVVVQVPEWIRALAYSPDGSMLAAPSTQGGIQLINPDSESLSEAVCSIVSRNLSPSEWESFIGQGQDIPYQQTCETLPIPAN
jgi:WD40 repeat protein